MRDWESQDLPQLNCAVPHATDQFVQLGHGSGGRLSADLVRDVFMPAFENDVLANLEDQAVVDFFSDSQRPAPRLAMTTDSFVVRPLFFPGGDIGKLAVCGTVNDLVVGGAEPLYLSAAFILEEGFPLRDLERIARSMRQVCQQVGIPLVAGDTKVVDRGKGDGVFITTTGVGRIASERQMSVTSVRPGDCIIVSGPIGDHGVAVMSAREGLEFETQLESDVAPLHDLTKTMLAACPTVRWMRDPTRGGISSTLNEVAAASKVGIHLHEATIPIRPAVQGACEMLGLDPLYVANEGKLIAAVPGDQADNLLSVMQQHPQGVDAAIIGRAVDRHAGMVTMETLIGGERIVAMLTGEQLPRIC